MMDTNENMDKDMCMMQMKKKMFLGLIVGLFLGWLITWAVMMQKKATVVQTQVNPVPMVSTKELGLYQAMDKLWMEHVWWTREYLKASANNSKDVALVAARLLQNQDDIGNAIKPYYGEAAGGQLTTLLRTHIQGAVDLVNAAKSGNQTALSAANTAWYANSDQVAAFLANANPNWTLSDLTSMMHSHLDLTKQEAVDLIGKKDDFAIVDFQRVENEIVIMADVLSKGIIKQFPASF